MVHYIKYIISCYIHLDPGTNKGMVVTGGQSYPGGRHPAGELIFIKNDDQTL